MLFTDIIAVTIALSGAVFLLVYSAIANARLERENRHLRARISEMRKQINTMVVRPF